MAVLRNSSSRREAGCAQRNTRFLARKFFAAGEIFFARFFIAAGEIFFWVFFSKQQ